MKTKHLLFGAMLTIGLGAAGCSSNSSCADGGICDTGGAGGTGAGGTGGTAGPAYFGISAGTYCFDILTIQPGFVDGCDIGVDLAVSTAAKRSALPVTYYPTATTLADGTAIVAGTLEVGTSGSLGRGVINMNTGTLLRVAGTTMLPAPDAACSWTQSDTSAVTLTAENTFTISVSEQESQFATSACAAVNMPAPAAGSCTSTWSWTMAIENPQVLTAPSCGSPN